MVLNKGLTDYMIFYRCVLATR